MPRLLDILTSPWAILPEKLLEIQEIYRVHLRGEKIDLGIIEKKTGKPLNSEPKGYEVINDVAVIPVEGIIAKKMNLFMQISGGTSSELLTRDFLQALNDKTARAIILAIDSPGGTVDGTQEVANVIYGSRGIKPVAVFSNGMMASAAYWIGSAADARYISGDTVQVGSIGVVAAHTDISKAEEQMGIKTTEIVAGKFKRIASQYGPLTPEGRANIQDAVDHVYSVFVADVARNLKTDVETVLENMADGRLFYGRQSIKAGMVNGVSTLDRVINMYGNPDSPRTVRAAVEDRIRETCFTQN